MKRTEIFKSKEHCSHGYKFCKRVNDIKLGSEVFRQVNCEKCGKYKYKINVADYHPDLLKEIIVIN